MSSATSNTRTWLAVLAGGLATPVLAYVLLVEAPPPRRIVIATGAQDGAYYKFARQYSDLLRQDGIQLEVRSTNGSLENLELLQDEKSDVDLALVQSGVADPVRCETLQSLCSLYREPFWIFVNGREAPDQLSQLAGKRIAIGTKGSGTRVIAEQLLGASGIDAGHAELVAQSGSDAADALQSGSVDAALFVAGIDATYIRKLIRNPDASLVELTQTQAILRRFRSLSSVTIPEGLLDMAHNLPPRDMVLVAPVATLVSRRSLHPALIPLLLKAAGRVHRGGDLLSSPGEFPSTEFTDLPVGDDAVHYFRFGPPMLQRILPFWIASLVDRMKLLIIPLLVLLMPLVRVAPPLVRWRTRRKIYLWYVALRQIDQKAIEGMSSAEAKTTLEGLKRLEQQIAHVGVPLSYMEEYYNLRLHLNLVRSRVETAVTA